MSTAPAVVSLAKGVNDILNRYVDIHDECFKFSVRKILPIPGFFKAIDYGSISVELTGLSCELEQVLAVAAQLRKSGLPTPQERFVDVLEQYGAALSKTLGLFRSICNQLYKKSKGEPGYSMKHYNEEMSVYSASVDHYKQLGAQLNSLAREVGLRAEP